MELGIVRGKRLVSRAALLLLFFQSLLVFGIYRFLYTGLILLEDNSIPIAGRITHVLDNERRDLDQWYLEQFAITRPL